MASQKIIFNILAVILALCILSVFSSPIPDEEAVAAAAADVSSESDDSIREAKFYGMGNSQASALAMSSSSGMGGYPGYGMGGANSFAAANAGASSIGGYPYGK